MPRRRNRRARSSSESSANMQINSGVAGRVKERKRVKLNDQQPTTGTGSNTHEDTSRRNTSRQATSRQTRSRQATSRQTTSHGSTLNQDTPNQSNLSQDTSNRDASSVPATPAPLHWRRVIDPNTPRELRAVNKSPGETSDEDAPTREELLAVRAAAQNIATNRLGGNEEPQGNSSALTSPEASSEHTPTALPFEPVSQRNTLNVPGEGTGIEGSAAEDLTLDPLTEEGPSSSEEVKHMIMEPKYPTEEWERKSYVNLDLIESHAYGLKNAPLLSKDELETAFEDGILVTTQQDDIIIHVTLDAFLDFPKLLRYAEECGGRKTGVVKIIVPDALTEYKSKAAAGKGQLRCQLMRASHEENSVSQYSSIFKIQSMSESKEDAHQIRKIMDRTNSEITKAGTNAMTNESGGTATAMKYCMFAQAEEKRREALGCVDLKMEDFEGNLLFQSKDKKWLDSRFFISEGAGTVFPLAVEGYGAHSITYHHTGANKVWYIVKPSEFQRIEEFLFSQRKNKADINPRCSQFVRHESIYVQPEVLAAGVEYTRVVQKPGEMVIIFPFAYHQGFNAGANIAETQIYGDKHWANIFAQNPDWYEPCGQECKGKGLWKPATVSLRFLGKSAEEVPVGGSGDGDGKGFVVQSDGLGPMKSSAGKYTQFGTYRKPNAQVVAVDELAVRHASPIFVSPGPDDVEV